MIRTSDNKTWLPEENKLVGSVSTVRGRDIHKPARVGEFPLFVEQSGNYRLSTYSKKLTEV